MTSKYLLASALLSAMTSSAMAVDSIVDYGNTSSGIVTNAMEGSILPGLTVSFKQPLIFPDLILPGPGQENSVTMSTDGTPTYTEYGNPTGLGPTLASSYQNHDGTNFQVGQISISGLQGQAINVSITEADTITPTINQKGYTMVPFVEALVDLPAASDAAAYTVANTTINFGGTLTAFSDNGTNVGKFIEDINVTVAYR